MSMLNSINKIAQDFDLVHQCSVEESMACGIGVCMTCVVPVKVNEEIKMLRTCIDGPVMDGSMIIWDKESLKEGLSK
jgi:dihydroorotate dehydrogenase electron transfer subunit